MTPDRDALRRAEAEATPGPWRSVEGDLEGKPPSEYLRTLLANREKDGTSSGRLFLTLAPNDIDPELGAEVVPATTGDGPRAAANARLIALARNALPALLDECDDLAARLAAAEAERDALAGQVEAVKALATGHPSEVVSKYAIRAALAGPTHEQGEG